MEVSFLIALFVRDASAVGPTPFRASLFGQTRPGLIRLLCWRLTGAIARLWA